MASNAVTPARCLRLRPRRHGLPGGRPTGVGQPAPASRSLHTTPVRLGGRDAAWPKVPRDMFNGLLKQQRENKDRFDREMRSARVASLELMQSDTKLPEDLGLLDSTLILNWRNQPSPISVEFFSFQWNRLKKRAREFFSLLVFKYQNGFFKTKLQLFSREKEAKMIHRQLHTAFAKNDIITIKQIAVEGVRDDLLSRMLPRPEDVRYEWTVKYKGARVMSDRATMLPFGNGDEDRDNSFIRQLVVRLRSFQTLKRIDSGVNQTGQPEERSVEKAVEEYVVLQKIMRRGKDTRWKMWGTTSETAQKDVLEIGADVRGEGKQNPVNL